MATATTITTMSPILHGTSRSQLIIWPIVWTIDNMSHRRSSLTSSLYNYQKNCFTIGFTTESTFTLELEPNYGNNLALTIRSTTTKCNASVKLYIITASGEKKCLYDLSNTNATWLYDTGATCSASFKSFLSIDKFISRAELFNPVNGYLPEDQLTIIAEFGFLQNSYVHSTFKEPVEPMKTVTVDSAIVEAYGQLLATGKLSDVTLIVEGKVIAAHKAILAIRSPVLAAMFEGDTVEAQENRAEITDVKVAVFEQMLAFIYTGAVPSLDQSAAEELLVAADKYQVDSLKAICESYLCSQLSPETAPNLFLFAEAINAPKLKESAVNFINSRAIDVFKAMASEPGQLFEIIRLLAVKNQEKDAAADK